MPTDDTLTLDAIARSSGGLTMVAMDQRESLRAMFDDAGAGRPDDETIIGFKLRVAEVLGARASGFLIDRHLGFDRLRSSGVLPDTVGVVLAADDLLQEEGEPVEDTEIDEAVLAPDFDLADVVALKLLVVWRRDARRDRRVETAQRFVEECARRGLLSVLEPVVRATSAELDDGTWDADEAIVEAARELSAVRPSLYKAQVPLAGRGTPAEQVTASTRLGEAIQTPWVVLSQGVDRESFPGAVESACRGGASGFLAGRALWSDVVGEHDIAAVLHERSVPRLERLTEIVDREARPWREA